jgi:hypothetical protein
MALRPLQFLVLGFVVALFSAALPAQSIDTAASTEVKIQRTLDLQPGTPQELLGNVISPLAVTYVLANGVDPASVTISGAVNCEATIKPVMAGDAAVTVTVVPETPGKFSFNLNVTGNQGETEQVPVEGTLLLHSDCYEDEFGVWHCHEHDHHHHCSAGEALGPWLMLSALVGVVVLALRRRDVA